ncbi:hypothetical protein L9F63_017456, partial [Diploptera punctata]
VNNSRYHRLHQEIRYRFSGRGREACSSPTFRQRLRLVSSRMQSLAKHNLHHLHLQ